MTYHPENLCNFEIIHVVELKAFYLSAFKIILVGPLGTRKEHHSVRIILVPVDMPCPDWTMETLRFPLICEESLDD